MPLTISTILSCAVDLISTDHFRVVAMTAAIGSCLSLQVFSLVAWVVTQPMKERESLAGDRD
jgi:hypothetical protein